MAGSFLYHLKLLCLLGLTITLAEETESILKRSRRETLDNEQNVAPNKSEKNVDQADGIKDNDNRSRQRKNFKKFQNKRRCFLGFPYDCPLGFEDSLLDWPRPWGWGPGPLYPEYGPDFHRGWGGHGGPWRVPGCSCGCNNHDWCCCGQEGGGGGGGASDCPQFNDAPPCQSTANKVGGPPQLHPFIGKQANFKGPFQMKQGKNINIQRGIKRQDITYGATPDVAEVPPVYQDPNQVPYGNWQVPQQTSPADQVVGSLFFWKFKGQNAPPKKQKRKR